jgi:hypothetical protein
MELASVVAVPLNCPSAIPSDEVKLRTTLVPLIRPETEALAKQGEFVEVIDPESIALVDPALSPCETDPLNVDTGTPVKADVKVP